MRILMIIIAVLCILSVYFMPLGIAILRRQLNTVSILVLNLLLGWTVIGWVVALVWAFKKEMTPTVVIDKTAIQ